MRVSESSATSGLVLSALTPLYSQSVLYSRQAVIEEAGGRVLSADITSDLARGDRFSEYQYRWK